MPNRVLNKVRLFAIDQDTLQSIVEAIEGPTGVDWGSEMTPARIVTDRIARGVPPRDADLEFQARMQSLGATSTSPLYGRRGPHPPDASFPNVLPRHVLDDKGEPDPDAVNRWCRDVREKADDDYAISWQRDARRSAFSLPQIFPPPKEVVQAGVNPYGMNWMARTWHTKGADPVNAPVFREDASGLPCADYPVFHTAWYQPTPVFDRLSAIGGPDLGVLVTYVDDGHQSYGYSLHYAGEKLMRWCGDTRDSKFADPFVHADAQDPEDVSVDEENLAITLANWVQVKAVEELPMPRAADLLPT